MFTNIRLRILAATAAMAAMGTPFFGVGAQAQGGSNYPDRPLEFVVQSSAGSSSDVFARELASAAEPILGQSIGVVLRPGGGGANQMSYIASADPDGYTFGVNTLTHFANMANSLRGTFSVDDFSWIVMIQEEPHVYVVLANAPYDDFASFDEHVSETGETVTVGGYGPVGSTVNIATDIGMQAAGAPYDWVGFNSSTEAITALLGGHLDMVALTPSNAIEFVEAGRVKILGVTTAERQDVIPDVPTLSELGYDIDTSWQQLRGVYGPAGIPDAIQQTLADALVEAAETEEFQEYMTNSGISARILGPEEYTEYGQRLMDVAEAALAAAEIQ